MNHNEMIKIVMCKYWAHMQLINDFWLTSCLDLINYGIEQLRCDHIYHCSVGFVGEIQPFRYESTQSGILLDG